MKKIETIYNLKGLGAFLIIIYHYTSRYKNLYNHVFEIPKAFNYFHYAVEIFLILSGLGIIISYKKSKDFNNFLLKRIKKIYIPYLIAITLIFICLQIFSLEGRGVSLRDYIGNIFMLQDFKFKYIDGAHWTLVLLIKFYILISIFKYYKIENFKSLPLFIILTVSPIILSINLIFFKILSFILFLKFISLFIAGIALMNILENKETDKMKILYVYSLFITCINYKITEYKNNYLILIFIFVLVYVAVITPDKLKILKNKILKNIGILSFEIYLLHQNIGYILLNYFIKEKINIYFSIVAVIIIIIIISYLFWLINQKIYRYIEEIEKKRAIYES